MSSEEFTRVVSQTSTLPNGMESMTDGHHSPSMFENGFLSKLEQLGIFMNLAIPGIKNVPKGLSIESTARAAPPEYFVVKRYKAQAYATATSFSQTASGSKQIKVVSAKFTVNNADLYIVGASIPIRLDAGQVHL